MIVSKDALQRDRAIRVERQTGWNLVPTAVICYAGFNL